MSIVKPFTCLKPTVIIHCCQSYYRYSDTDITKTAFLLVKLRYVGSSIPRIAHQEVNLLRKDDQLS